MRATYTDLHIHTSENADEINENYHVKVLIDNIKKFSNTTNILISLTDHNVINKSAYTELLSDSNDINVILGVELHIRNYIEKDPYHCHIYFNLDKDEIVNAIDDINLILGTLYPIKMVIPDMDIPFLEDIVKQFDSYDFLILPHGGQSHRTFDKTIPHNVKFDTVLERNIYYNQFDGFTSRSNKGLERTQEYFTKLGILSFVNLLTCTDNYNPVHYPNTKAINAEDFIPTWMLSEPTFSGLRLALSESTRLLYQIDEPIVNTDFIKSVKLENDLIDVNINLTSGLNVIIGGSSSGKTLLMDSIYRKLYESDDLLPDSIYSHFMVDNMEIDNPVGNKPHYISQNYITKVIDEKYDEGIEKIDIIRNTFLGDSELDLKVKQSLLELNMYISNLLEATKEIEVARQTLNKIGVFHTIISDDTLKENPFDSMLPSSELLTATSMSEHNFDQYIKHLKEFDELVTNNPFFENVTSEISIIRNTVTKAREKHILLNDVAGIVRKHKKSFDKEESAGREMEVIKKQSREQLLHFTRSYTTSRIKFNENLNKILKFELDYKTEPIISQGHKLYIENNFKMNNDIFLEELNRLLKTEYKLKGVSDLTPESLFESKHSKKSPKVKDYSDFSDRIFDRINASNKKTYKIIDKNGTDLQNLSPGWRTAVILDIILGYTDDVAPIFIDQPEDNLATNYINDGLVQSIKNSKKNRQIIIVSHNATIPMLADAQNIIFCKNEGKKIVIRSSAMEGYFGKKSVIDHIVEITDGGKSSVKKRVKKYNLKTFREDN